MSYSSSHSQTLFLSLSSYSRGVFEIFMLIMITIILSLSETSLYTSTTLIKEFFFFENIKLMVHNVVFYFGYLLGAGICNIFISSIHNKNFVVLLLIINSISMYSYCSFDTNYGKIFFTKCVSGFCKGFVTKKIEEMNKTINSLCLPIGLCIGCIANIFFGWQQCIFIETIGCFVCGVIVFLSFNKKDFMLINISENDIKNNISTDRLDELTEFKRSSSQDNQHSRDNFDVRDSLLIIVRCGIICILTSFQYYFCYHVTSLVETHPMMERKLSDTTIIIIFIFSVIFMRTLGGILSSFFLKRYDESSPITKKISMTIALYSMANVLAFLMMYIRYDEYVVQFVLTGLFILANSLVIPILTNAIQLDNKPLISLLGINFGNVPGCILYLIYDNFTLLVRLSYVCNIFMIIALLHTVIKDSKPITPQKKTQIFDSYSFGSAQDEVINPTRFGSFTSVNSLKEFAEN